MLTGDLRKKIIYIPCVFVLIIGAFLLLCVNAHAERTDEEDEVISENDIKSAEVCILINKTHPLPEGYDFTTDMVKAKRGYLRADERAADCYAKMANDALKEDINLIVISGYRNLDRQKTLFNKKIYSYRKNEGMSYLEAYKNSAMTVTIPGTSEHEAGLALDIACREYTMLNEGFADTDAGKWLKDNAYKYGFILRYPKDKEYLTGIEFEPWHYRFVGKEAAKIIYDKGWTLEEYVRAYKN